MNMTLQRRPTSVGEILKEEYMVPLGMTVTELAKALNVHRNTASALVRDESRLSTIMAHKLARVFNTTPRYWWNIQVKRDIWKQGQKEQ